MTGTRVYVGNLSFQTTEASLRDLCAGDGRTVASVTIVTDRETGHPRGFGFVEFGNANDAKAAITVLNGLIFDGRPLTVNEAKERSASPPGGSAGAGRGGHKGW